MSYMVEAVSTDDMVTVNIREIDGEGDWGTAGAVIESHDVFWMDVMPVLNAARVTCDNMNAGE